MKFIVDSDLHIHSQLSLCSDDTEQTPERILNYAKENGLKTICLTDHFWDETLVGASDWYSEQDYAHICKAKPLPQAEGVRFLFGCETELNSSLTVGVSKERFDLFDFIIIPTTHFHFVGYTITEEDAATPQNRADAWIRRFDAVLDMDLPFEKVGFAHLTCHLIGTTREEYLETLRLLPEDGMRRVFTKAAKLGAGIELNLSDINFTEDEADIILRPFRIAKECGCKFYCGSDSHHPETFIIAKASFEKVAERLGLTEDDKFVI